MSGRRLLPKAKDFFRVVLKDPQRKDVLTILREYSGFFLTNKVVSEQYFSKFLYRKGVTNFDDYILTHKVLYKCWDLNDKEASYILDHKYLFEQYFGQFGLSICRSTAFNHHSLFYTGTKFLNLSGPDAFLDFIGEISGQLKESENIFIKKTEGSGGGKDIYKVSWHGLQSDRAYLETVYRKVITSGFIYQEEIVQHAEMNRLNPHCVNTLRVDTFTNSRMESRVMSANMRIGLNKAYVDNTSSGGAYVSIDLEKGVLRADAMSDFTHGHGFTCQVHPENNLRFEGFVIPYFDEIRKLVETAASKLPQVKLIGWDVAVTPEGPVIVEGNEWPNMMFGETGQKGFRKNPVFMEMYREALGRS